MYVYVYMYMKSLVMSLNFVRKKIIVNIIALTGALMSNKPPANKV